MTYIHVTAEVDTAEVISELSDEEIAAEVKRRKLIVYRPACGDPFEYPPSTAASILTMDQLREKTRLRGDAR